MKHFLVVVDIQNDFVDGALGSAEAVAIVENAAKKIREFEGDIFVTFDTHGENYLDTAEGAKLPVPHCIKGTFGWELNSAVADALLGKGYISVEKPTFGSMELPRLVKDAAGGDELAITVIGLCTDICVISNALCLKARLWETPISVCKECCAGVTPASHANALEAMKLCQITVK